MPISELGYRHWEGRRTGTLRRCLAIARSEVAIAYQSSKLLRRFLIFAWMPILYFCPFFLAVGYVADPANDLGEGALLTQLAFEFLSRDAIEQIRQNPEAFLPGIWSIAFYYFFAYTQSLLSMIVVAIVGPPLIAKDLRSRAFLVYFSKPIRPWQYLLGKLFTVIFFVFSMTLFPALLLYAVGVALSPDVNTLLATSSIVLKIGCSSILTAVPIAMVVLLLSSFTRNRMIATFSWVVVWGFGEIAFRVIAASGSYSSKLGPPSWASLLSLRELGTRATAGIFDVRASIETLFAQLGEAGGRLEHVMLDLARDLGDARLMDVPLSKTRVLQIADSGCSPTLAIAVLVGLSVCCAFVVLRRVKSPVRI